MALLSSKLFQTANTVVREDKKVSADAKQNPKAAPLWTGLDVAARLEECAASDPKHIRQPDVGPHVTAIHIALETIASAPKIAVPPQGSPSTPADADARLFNAAVRALAAAPVNGGERAAAEYKASTARAVRAYKSAREIRRRPTDAIDDIVGIMTIKMLDHDLQSAAGAKLVPVIPVVPVDNEDVATDFIIHFLGGRSQFAAGIGDGVSGLSLGQYNAAPDDPMEFFKASGRRLHIVSRGSDPTNFENGRLLTSVVDEIRATLARPKRKLGIICMHGSSAGGRHALHMAARIGQEKLPLTFLGLEDAAFFAADSSNRPVPGTIFGKASNLPKFQPPELSAGIKHNFFQNARNFFRPSLGRGFDWIGANDNSEIHGEVIGFENFPIAISFSDSPQIPQEHRNEPHSKAVTEGRNRAGRTISRLLFVL